MYGPLGGIIMALGNYDNNKKEQYTPVYYSEYGTGNPEGIDPSALSYTFYSRMLKLSISPLKMNNGDKIAYDHDNAAVAWLTHTKARMLYDQIKRVLPQCYCIIYGRTSYEGMERQNQNSLLYVKRI